MRVLVTRPAAEARRWVEDLRARGHDAQACPLIDIAPMPDLAPLRAAWRCAAECDVFMFVSGNAAQHFFAARPADAPALRARLWAPGPGTVLALRDAGVPAGQIDAPDAAAAQFDSESLWQRVQAQVHAGLRVCIVRGSDAQGRGAGRDWMAQRLQAAGATVTWLSAYRRIPPQWTRQQEDRARQAANDGTVWLLSSSEAVSNLVRLLPGQSWQHARAVATHARIAQAAQDAGFGVVRASRAALDDVVASIESLG
jgi:uroporphyrinogen-III synthase